MKKTICFGVVLGYLLVLALLSYATAEVNEVFKMQYPNNDISGAKQISCTEVQYYQGGSYKKLYSKTPSKDFEIAVVYGLSDSPQEFHLTILNDKILLDNEEFSIVKRTEEDIQAIGRPDGWAGVVVVLMIDLKHGTMLYNKAVGRGLIGTKTSTFITRCRKEPA